MKKILQIILVLILLIAVPGAAVYVGAAFVKLDWIWIPLVTEIERLYAVVVIIGLWIIFSYMVTHQYYEDDRRDPKKKG